MSKHGRIAASLPSKVNSIAFGPGYEYDVIQIDHGSISRDGNAADAQLSGALPTQRINDHVEKGWELLQVYSAQQPCRTMLGTSFETRVFAVFRRIKQCPSSD